MSEREVTDQVAFNICSSFFFKATVNHHICRYGSGQMYLELMEELS